MKLMKLIGVVMSVALTAVASAQPCAPAWSDEFALQPPAPGMNGPVLALTLYNAELIAGGNFSAAGGVDANSIARWDGTSWQPLGSGIEGEVSALAVYNNELIAAGSFTTAGGVFANRIARWDGTQWRDLFRGPVSGEVLALVVYNGALIAGGTFSTYDGYPYIASWNGDQWSSSGSMNNAVTSLSVHNNELIVGGNFSSPGSRIARFDGTQWRTLGSGMNGGVSAFAVYNNELIAGGAFTSAGGAAANHVARWDGVQWHPLGSGVSGSISALSVHNGEVIAGGAFTFAGSVEANFVARWDGTEWSALGSGMNSSVVALTDHDGVLVAGGGFTTAGGGTAERIARWDGALWHQDPDIGVITGLQGPPADLFNLEHPVIGLAVVGPSLIDNGLLIFDGDLWQILEGRGRNLSDHAVFDDGTGPALYIADQRTYKWTGTEWTLLGTGKNDTVTTIEVYDDGAGAGGGPSLYSAGNFYAAGGVPASRIARWDGEEWNALVTLGGGLADGQANDMAVYDDGTGPALYVAGEFTFVNDEPIAYLARWNGSSWSRVGAGVNGPVTSLKVLDDGSGPALFIRGSFTNVGSQQPFSGISANRIARWNGVWNGLAGGVVGVGDVLDLAVFNGGSGPMLYAVGSFTNMSGDFFAPKKHAARWTGMQWEPLGNFGLNATARTAVVFNDGVESGLFVGGDFTVAGGLAARYIAKWNGQQWSVLGLGTSGPVHALAEFESPEARALYIGGNFTSAGGVPASYFTRYEACDIQPPSAFSLQQPADGAFDVSLTPTLLWTPSNGSTSYRVEVDDEPSFTFPLVLDSVVQANSLDISPGLLARSTDYFWRVTATGLNGSVVAMPDPAVFTTIPPPPAPFALISPAPGSSGVSVTPTLSWEPATGATFYSVQIVGRWSASTTQTSIDIPAGILSQHTGFIWRVQTSNPGGVTWGTPNPGTFTTGAAPPPPFALVLPADGAVSASLSPTFSWETRGPVQSWVLTVDTDAAFALPHVWQISGSFPILSPPYHIPVTLQGSTVYYWRVVAINEGLETVGTPATSTFVTERAPCCPGDADNSRVVNFADVTNVLANFNMVGTPGQQNPGDADCSGTVNFADITAVLTNWGVVCP